MGLHAVTYYVSPNGNDGNSGTSTATPWRTINRVQQAAGSLQPGDQVLFERGGTFRGKLTINSNGSQSSPIIIGAYGTGALPLILGSQQVTGWTVHQGNIWRANVGQNVKYVWVAGQRMTLARFPNTGWLRTSWANTTQLSSGSITQAGGHWTGAQVVLRTSNWSYEVSNITAHSGTTLTYANMTFNPGNGDWGFFLQNKLSELDSPGEWFYDAQSGNLYLWAPNNANPNNLVVEASVHDYGVEMGWQRQHVRVRDLEFRYQRIAGYYNPGGNNNRLENCAISHTYHGVRSAASNSLYHNNTISHTYATGMNVLDQNSTVSNNVLTDIAVVPGLGENAWGYFGIHVQGSGVVLRENRLQRIGYSGIFFHGNTLVERNVIHEACFTLNDGGAVHFDNSNGGTIQDNIIYGTIGNLDSHPTNHPNRVTMAQGIFFGMGDLKNITVQRNTVWGCNGPGIFVDHSMVSDNYQIHNNTLFNNLRTQLFISNNSNATGPGAQAPYYLPSHNDHYSGNIMYSLHADQHCMQQHGVYTNNFVDFGSFSNNRYFNPYNELSIQLTRNGFSNVSRWSLEHWRDTYNKDQGSTRHPERMELFEVTATHGSSLVPNGFFNSNVNSWVGWPSSGQLSHVTNMLDNGSMRVHYPSNNGSADFFLYHNTSSTALQIGEYYELRYTVQAAQHGILRVEPKGQSQGGTPNFIARRDVPFSTERRDLRMVFISDRAEPMQTYFTHHFSEPTYWIDNVELHRVSVAPAPPEERHILLVNDQSTAQSIALPAGCWRNVNGANVTGPVTLQPFSSMVLYRYATTGCAGASLQTQGARVLLAGATLPSGGTMRADLRDAGLLPTAEPYTALGLTVVNTGAQMTNSVMQATGTNAPVDWLVLETRGAAPSYPVIERIAAVVRADGSVVSSDGSTQIAFPQGVVGRHLAIHHRNHLPVMTASPIASSGSTVDLRSGAVPLFGTNATTTVGGFQALWPGDVNRDGQVKYTGTANDRDLVLSAIGNTVPTNVVSGYLGADINLDGLAKYMGPENDRDLILQSIGGVVPTTTVQRQMP
jgi:hypothetical protein